MFLIEFLGMSNLDIINYLANKLESCGAKVDVMTSEKGNQANLFATIGPEIDGGIGNQSYSEHNYYYYRTTGAVDFRAKNIESFDSLEENSIDLYASVKSLYLQNRDQQIKNSKYTVETQSHSDWEEIDTN